MEVDRSRVASWPIENVTDLSTFDNAWYSPGRNQLVQMLWFFVGAPLVRCPLLPFSGVRRVLLRLFGAEIGRGVVIKPGVRVKFPWRLSVGDHSWIGEDCWLDNLADIRIGTNVCLSQGVYLCTGSHDWSDPAFGLIVKPISVRDGAWVGARASIAPGVTVGLSSVAAMGSVVTRDLPAHEIHAGNPASFVRRRPSQTSNN